MRSLTGVILSAGWTIAVAVGALVALLAAGESAARDLSAAEEAALAARIDSFSTAVRDRDFDTVTSIVPPPFIEEVAQEAGMPNEQVRAAMAERMTELFAEATLVDFDIDMAEAERRTLPDGTPYLLIPTRTVIEADGKTVEASNHTIAMTHDGAWYLVRLDSVSAVTALTATFPEFAGESLPTGSRRVLPQ